MKLLYTVKTSLCILFSLIIIESSAQTPTVLSNGICAGVVADFNSNDNGFNSPSIYGSIFDSSFYFNSARGYWTDYMPPMRVNAPGFPRVLNIISPPYNNPNPTGSFNVGFHYIVGNPVVDRFQVRIISVTQTPTGTVTNVEATSGVQAFLAWSTPSSYIDTGASPTPLLNGFQGNVCIRLIDPDIVNSLNTTFRVEVSYIINEPLFAVFDDLSIGPLNSPLPVSFIGLLANRNTDNTVSLKWDVSEEINVAEYQVERSDNGTLFMPVGSVIAKGKSIYTYNNPAPEGNLFYRIKSVDIDGHVKYSGVIRLQGNSSTSFADGLHIYPVPAQDEITIAHKKLERDARLVITSTEGKIMKNIIPAIGSSHTMISLNGLAPGIYYIRLDDGKGGILIAKLVKN